MSYSINFNSPDGGEEVFALCNIGSWGKFKEYVDNLGAGYGHLRTFVRDGEVQDTSLLSKELLDAHELEAPIEGSAAQEVLGLLIGLVGAGEEDEHAYISQE